MEHRKQIDHLDKNRTSRQKWNAGAKWNIVIEWNTGAKWIVEAK